ncbi:MAG TPA: DinB family protein [Terracidiphilus sp.]|nr:DinB family protein [Terracidiphilus sp.]
MAARSHKVQNKVQEKTRGVVHDEIRDGVHTQLGRAAVRMFAANERMNQMLIERLDPAAWNAKLPAKASGRVRTIAAIFTHMHNMRRMWVRLTAPHLKVPVQLKHTQCTPRQARAGLAESAARCAEMLGEALGGGGRVEKFVRDGWAQPWPVGVEMLCYMVAHEAHHRGQVCMLAHQLGFPLPVAVMAGIWNWEKIWKECGASVVPAGRDRLRSVT